MDMQRVKKLARSLGERRTWAYRCKVGVARLWAYFCHLPPQHTKIVEPESALPFFRLYLLVAFSFALVYSAPEQSFVISGNIGKLSGLESIYFSVVSITTLGFGDIAPHSSVMRFAVAIEALCGIFILGLFLVWMGHSLSREQQRQLNLSERARLDRPLFPKYIRMIEELGSFLGSFDTEPMRPTNSYGWMMFDFGPQRVPVSSTFFDVEAYIRLHGGTSNLPENATSHWERLMLSLESHVQEVLGQEESPIDDVTLIRNYEYLQRLSETTREDLASVDGNSVSRLEYVRRRCELVTDLVGACESTRNYISSKADRAIDGTTARYEHFYRRTRPRPSFQAETTVQSKAFTFGEKIGKRFRSLRKFDRDV